MIDRRDFLRSAAALAGLAGPLVGWPASIQRALAIEPEPGSSYLDAEHVVILMQENRSFDHAFGSLRGVRGFNDPCAIALANGDPVWVQPDRDGRRFVPFRLNMKESNSTWMGSLPHSWSDQVDARNHGRYDRWLSAKRSGRKQYSQLPLTLGYYTRDDIPFYYALADAFTICDQHFCSALTGTNANRLYFWTGTIREQQTADSTALVDNSDIGYDRLARWTTFPERLQDHGISWKIYQNELSLESGLSENEDSWLGNFDDNTLEWFEQYHVFFASSRRAFINQRLAQIPAELDALRQELAAATDATKRASLKKRLDELADTLNKYKSESERFTAENYAKLSSRDRELHERAFCTNSGDPAYRKLVEISYRDGDKVRRVLVPKGDVLYQFRRDVADRTLPTVSWIVSPAEFSDHPGSAWYGAWYVSEVLNILTSNPDVWRKTIFILTYDENDGYFDHVPPFVAPHPRRPETGRVSHGIDPGVDFVELEQDRRRNPGRGSRESSIGLGYRVPLIVASPWSRGGCVCSQVFDHTSVLQFLERLLTHKIGRPVTEPNISRWRRAVCGDLTSIFQSAADAAAPELPFLARDVVVEEIHRAQFKEPPVIPRPLLAEELDRIRAGGPRSSPLPRQEPGTRRSCPLPYELCVDGVLEDDREHFRVRFEARNRRFGRRSAGAPFTAYAFAAANSMSVRNYAVEPGDAVDDSWKLSDFEGGQYRLRVHGPNGFFREFRGNSRDPRVRLRLEPGADSALVVEISNGDGNRPATIVIRDNAYGSEPIERTLAPKSASQVRVDTAASHGWYDVTVRIEGASDFSLRGAGRVETGAWSMSDPAMA